MVRLVNPSLPYHLLDHYFHQVFDALIRVLLRRLPDHGGLQHLEHLLTGDVAVTVQVVDVEAVWRYRRWSGMETDVECNGDKYSGMEMNVEWNGDECGVEWRLMCCSQCGIYNSHSICSSRLPFRKMDMPFTHSCWFRMPSLSLSNARKTAYRRECTVYHYCPAAPPLQLLAYPVQQPPPAAYPVQQPHPSATASLPLSSSPTPLQLLAYPVQQPHPSAAASLPLSMKKSSLIEK